MNMFSSRIQANLLDCVWSAYAPCAGERGKNVGLVDAGKKKKAQLFQAQCGFSSF